MLPPERLAAFFAARPALAERAALALLRRAPPPEQGWTGLSHGRNPPVVWDRRPGHCPICRQPTFARGSWWPEAGPARANRRWHAACLVAWRVWTDPAAQARYLAERQGLVCPETGRRLNRVRRWTGRDPDGRSISKTSDHLVSVQVDHHVPLWQVRREGNIHPWPAVLAFWGVGNLRALSSKGHRIKTGREVGLRNRLS